MEIEDKKRYIENYLKNYFYKWLIKDIKIILRIMEERKIGFTLPIVLLVCSGIDFSGGLICGFNSGNVGSRSKHFIKKWMGRINHLYEDEDMSEVVYNLVRCGSVHQAMYKKGVEIISDSSINNHLCLSKSRNILVNTFQFADDFIKAIRRFRKEYINNNIEDVFQNLHSMVESTKDFSDLRKRLRADNYICETIYAASSHSSSISIGQPSSITDNKSFVIIKEGNKETAMSKKINNHFMKVRKFRGIGADFRGVKIEVYKLEAADKPIFSVYNEVSKSQIPDEQDVDYDDLVKFMESRILSNIRKSKYVDYISPMFKNHIRKLAEKGQEIVWDI